MGLAETLSKFAEGTSLHGLGFVAQKTSSKGKRVAWMCLFLTSLVYAISQIKHLSKCKFTWYFISDMIS